MAERPGIKEIGSEVFGELLRVVMEMKEIQFSEKEVIECVGDTRMLLHNIIR